MHAVACAGAIAPPPISGGAHFFRGHYYNLKVNKLGVRERASAAAQPNTHSHRPDGIDSYHRDYPTSERVHFISLFYRLYRNDVFWLNSDNYAIIMVKNYRTLLEIILFIHS